MPGSDTSPIVAMLAMVGLIAAFMASRKYGRTASQRVAPSIRKVAYSFSFFLSIYLLTVCVRVLGLLYVTKKRELAWLEH